MDQSELNRLTVVIAQFEDYLAANYSGSQGSAKHFGITARLKLKQILFVLEDLSKMEWNTWTEQKAAALTLGESFYYSAFRLIKIFNSHLEHFKVSDRSNSPIYNIIRIRNHLIEHPHEENDAHVNRFGWKKGKGLIYKPKHGIGDAPYENGVFDDAIALISFLESKL